MERLVGRKVEHKDKMLTPKKIIRVGFPETKQPVRFFFFEMAIYHAYNRISESALVMRALVCLKIVKTVAAAIVL